MAAVGRYQSRYGGLFKPELSRVTPPSVGQPSDQATVVGLAGAQSAARDLVQSREVGHAEPNANINTVLRDIRFNRNFLHKTLRRIFRLSVPISTWAGKQDSFNHIPVLKQLPRVTNNVRLISCFSVYANQTICVKLCPTGTC